MQNPSNSFDPKELSKDWFETKKFLEDIKPTGYLTLDNNFNEHIRAVLNYRIYQPYCESGTTVPIDPGTDGNGEDTEGNTKLPTAVSFTITDSSTENNYPTAVSFTISDDGDEDGGDNGGSTEPPVELSEFDLNPVTTLSTSYSLKRDIKYVTPLKVASSPANIASEFTDQAPTLKRLVGIIKERQDVNPAVPQNTETAKYTFVHSFVEIRDKDWDLIYSDGVLYEDEDDSSFVYFDKLQDFENSINDAINPPVGTVNTPGEKDIRMSSGNIIKIEDELGTRYAVSYEFSNYVNLLVSYPKPLYKSKVSVGFNYDQAYFAGLRGAIDWLQNAFAFYRAEDYKLPNFVRPYINIIESGTVQYSKGDIDTPDTDKLSDLEKRLKEAQFGLLEVNIGYIQKGAKNTLTKVKYSDSYSIDVDPTGSLGAASINRNNLYFQRFDSRIGVLDTEERLAQEVLFLSGFVKYSYYANNMYHTTIAGIQKNGDYTINGVTKNVKSLGYNGLPPRDKPFILPVVSSYTLAKEQPGTLSTGAYSIVSDNLAYRRLVSHCLPNR